MAGSESETGVTWEHYDAVLFDLDGVLTDTDRIHAACGKRTFDEFLDRKPGGEIRSRAEAVA